MEKYIRMINFRIEELEGRIILGQSNLDKYNKAEKTHENGKILGSIVGNINNSRDNLNFLKDLKRELERG